MRPPPSPADMLILTAACAFSAPVMTNLATRNCPAAASCQPGGTSHAGLPCPEPFPDAGPDGAASGAPPMGGCEGGNPADAVTAGKLTDLRNSINAGFC